MAGRPKSTEPKNVVASTRLNEEQTQFVNRFAKDHNISFSTAIRTIIDINKKNYLGGKFNG